MHKSGHSLGPSPLNSQGQKSCNVVRLEQSVPSCISQTHGKAPKCQQSIYGGEISDDEIDSATDSTASSNEDLVVSSTQNHAGASRLNKINLEARRPLHAKRHSLLSLEKDCISRRSPVLKGTTLNPSPRQKAAPYQSSFRKGNKSPSDDEDGEVEFVREIKGYPKPRYRKIIVSGRLKRNENGENRTSGSGIERTIKLLERPHPAETRTNEVCLSGESAALCENHDCRIQDASRHNGIACVSKHSCRSRLHENGSNKKDSGIDDDLVIVASGHNKHQSIDFPTLKRIVTTVVYHYVEENNADELTLQFVLDRLKSLHHRDFLDRCTEVEYCTRKALERCQKVQHSKSFQEVRPGITLADIDTLSADNWLNDVIINQYMKLLVTENPNYGALSSFWYDELLRGVEPSLPDRWLGLNHILVPTCADSHWSLLCYCPCNNRVEIYSSLTVSDTEIQYAQMLIDFFATKATDNNGGQSFEINNLPRQENENDCGVYVCMFARCIVCGNSFEIVPQQVSDFRDWLKKEILKGQVFSTPYVKDSGDDSGSRQCDMP